jgi:hypothetical protein
MNLDPRSRTSNTEVALTADSVEIGEQIGAFFDEAMAPQNAFRVELAVVGDGNEALQWVGTSEGSIVRYDSEPLASWWRVLVSRVLATLIPRRGSDGATRVADPANRPARVPSAVDIAALRSAGRHAGCNPQPPSRSA